jgi:8-oxo-dGTP diphosphatase
MGDAKPPILAGGAVVWRRGPAPEVALVHRPKYDDWSFPKGKLEPGEHVLRGAVREVQEETGMLVRLGRRLPTSVYPKNGRTKRVDYWAARAVSTSEFTPNDEVDEMVWARIVEAERLLSYAMDIDLLHEFAAGPLVTHPLVILRHGSAGEKSKWKGPAELRPLDDRGLVQATGMAEILAAYAPRHVLSSATARCVETVLPYARRIGADVVTDRAFTIDTDLDRACERLLGLAHMHAPVVVCTHGEIVSELVTRLCRELGEKVPEDPSLSKGAFWVAHLSDDDPPAIAALERHSA